MGQIFSSQFAVVFCSNFFWFKWTLIKELEIRMISFSYVEHYASRWVALCIKNNLQVDSFHLPAFNWQDRMSAVSTQTHTCILFRLKIIIHFPIDIVHWEGEWGTWNSYSQSEIHSPFMCSFTAPPVRSISFTQWMWIMCLKLVFGICGIHSQYKSSPLLPNWRKIVH